MPRRRSDESMGEDERTNELMLKDTRNDPTQKKFYTTYRTSAGEGRGGTDSPLNGEKLSDRSGPMTTN